jgi:hypothetical protein
MKLIAFQLGCRSFRANAFSDERFCSAIKAVVTMDRHSSLRAAGWSSCNSKKDPLLRYKQQMESPLLRLVD